MPARLLYRSRFIYPDGAIREMVLWKLPKAAAERRHGLKYRLHYSSANSTITIRYDNEAGKGDHRHYMDHEDPYPFLDVETLVADFLADIEKVREEAEYGKEKRDKG
ncbi:MAG TPA: DUF6516 family protein [Candidatus Brocadiales bacterium]|nr:DUF6516 family protein [Candidatus Brocadiales bacterium]